MITWRHLTSVAEPVSRALAADESLMARYVDWADNGWPQPTLRIYTLKPDCVLVGRFQNLHAEVYESECRSLGMDINRRMTGGGTILMGERQLMIALVCSADDPIIPAHPARILPKLARGIIAGLLELGINAEYRAKNDIVVQARKIGGSSICIEETGVFLYHATVLVDFDIPLMLRTLKISAEKISDKLAGPYDERITTVSRELGHHVSTERVISAVRRGFERVFKMRSVIEPLSSQEQAQIDILEQTKYKSDSWIYQRLPAADMSGSCITKTPGGLIHAYVSLTGDTTKNVLITGDFLSESRTVRAIEAALKWNRTDRESIIRTIRAVMATQDNSIQSVSADELALAVIAAVADARRSSGVE
jgi:lipoate-protein ligase A